MAERRMFAKTIIDSDAFLDMPLSTQALYFHLSMRADDDGFVNSAKKIQRTIGGNDDDFKILLSKKFIIPFETGVCVIKHWKIHNLIQKDRYKPTLYESEKSKLTIKNNNSYTLDTDCIHDVSKLESQVSLGESSLGQVSLVEENKAPRKNALFSENDFEIFWKRYPRKVGKDAALKSWIKLKPRIDDVMFALSWQIESDAWNKNDGQFIPNPATYLNQGRWKDEPKVNEGNPF